MEMAEEVLHIFNLHYAAGTARICANAISAIHKLNDLSDPVSTSSLGILKAIEAVGVCGV